MNFTLEDGPVQLTNLSHLGIAVRDAEAVVRKLSSFWNVGTPESFDYTPSEEDLIAGPQFSVRLVFLKFGPLTIELLQPLDDRSIWSTFIEDHGEGIHHVAFGVSNYDEMVERFEAAGHPMMTAAVFEGTRWCYFEMQPGGVVVEFREEYGRS